MKAKESLGRRTGCCVGHVGTGKIEKHIPIEVRSNLGT